jgi:hypothetical protein
MGPLTEQGVARGTGGRSLYGLLAEFATPGGLLEAARTVRDAGYKRWDCYSPFPVHGLDRAMGMRDTRLPWLVLGGGLTGASVAILMQWWMNAVDYPLIVAGKPFFSLPANIPVAFELTVLLSAITAFAGMFLFNELPQFFHPTFRSERFRRATTDRFFIAIEASDPRFEIERTEALLRSLGSTHVEWLED